MKTECVPASDYQGWHLAAQKTLNKLSDQERRAMGETQVRLKNGCCVVENCPITQKQRVNVVVMVLF